MEKIFPMKPVKIKTQDKLDELLTSPNYIMEEKIDGVRGLIYIDPKADEWICTTRGESRDNPGVPIDNTHRCIDLLPDYVEIVKVCSKTVMLDGEWYSDTLDSAKVAGILNYKSTVPVDKSIKFKLFDVYYEYCEDQWMVRKKLLNEFYKNSGLVHYKVFELNRVARTADMKQALLDTIFFNGKEGVVFKNIYSLYYPGERKVNRWYKYKKKDTIDAKIIGFEAPEPYYTDPQTQRYDTNRLTKFYENNWIGSIIAQLESGEKIKVSGMTDITRRELSKGGIMSKVNHKLKGLDLWENINETSWDNSPYIGRWIEVEYMEKTSTGKLRHPRLIRIREDVEK